MLELKRKDNWRACFSDEIDRIRRMPFDWRSHDCAMGLAVGCILAITGVDLGEPYRGKYSTIAGGLKVLKENGFDTVADMAASMLPEVHPSMAHIGDIVSIPTDSEFGNALGVVNGERAFVLMPNGIGTVDLLDATRAFKVG